MKKTNAQIRDDFELIARERGACDIGFPNLAPGIPDQSLLFALDLCDESSEK